MLESSTKIVSFKDLIVWQRSFQLAKDVYNLLGALPKTETYGMVSQMRRCAVSIPSNIAEGENRKTKKDFLHFLRIAYGSLAELETQLMLSRDLYDVQTESLEAEVEELSKMLRSFIYKLQNNSSSND